jgi:hypothetical protein
MEKIGAISKDRKNPVGFKYRGIEDALNNMQPAMIELGLSIETKCYEFKSEHFVEKGKEKDRLVFHSTLLMDVTFCAADGSKSTRNGAGEGLDTAGDKATNKAMSAAFKYAVFLGLCIPVEDGTLPDADATNHKVESVALPPQFLPALPGTIPTVIIQGQIDDILKLAQGAEMPPEVLTQAVAKYGVVKLSELSYIAAQELIAKLMSLQPFGSRDVPF